MKALVYEGPYCAEVRELAEPKGWDGGVKLRLAYCGVCGTDIGIHMGSHPRAAAPLTLGHEFVGRVEESRGGSGRFAVGDRVVAYPLVSCGKCRPCRTGTPHVCETLKLIGIDRDGGMAESIWVDEAALFKLPDDLPDTISALAEPLAVVIRSLHQAQFSLLDSAVVIGAGPIGVLTGLALRDAGASRIVMSDVNASRLSLCAALGFETVNAAETDLVDEVARISGGEGVDVVFECSGSESAAREMTRCARIGGTVCLTGVHKAPRAVDLREINFKEQRLVGSRVYTHHEFGQSVPLAQRLAADLAKVVTHTVPLSKSHDLFELIADPARHAVKVLVDCTS